MLGFKSFTAATITITGIELLRRLYKGQFNLSELHPDGHRVPAIWKAMLVAR
jgi:hypothetical protein